MNTNLKLGDLEQISSKMKLSKSAAYMMKAQKSMDVVTDAETSTIQRGLASVSFLTNGLKAVLAEQRENQRYRKMLAKTLEVPEEKVAGDINDFLNSSEAMVAVANDFQYSALLENKDLSDIAVILGDAKLAALKDLSRISNLRYVAGNIQVNGSVEELQEHLPNLEYVGGTIVDLSGQVICEKRLQK